MSVSAARVTASTVAVALNTASTAGTNLVVKNTHATEAVDLGASTVAAAAGFSLVAGATVTVELDAGDVLYAIRSNSTDVVLAVLRT